MLLDLKILQSARTNEGADAIFGYTMKIIRAHPELAHLRDATLRYHSEAIMAAINDTILRLEYLQQRSRPQDSKNKKDCCLPDKTRQWTLDHPTEQVARDYHAIQVAKANHDRATNVKHTFTGACDKITTSVMHDPTPLLIGATVSIGSTLRHKNWSPDVVILDEASQCTEGDGARALVDTRPSLWVVAGDTAQMAPFCESESNGQCFNIWANVLKISVLERAIYSTPRGNHHYLTMSFRSHPSCLDLVSMTHYGHRLRTGRLATYKWSTELSRNVNKVLTSPDYLSMFTDPHARNRVLGTQHTPNAALHNRQYFFNVRDRSQVEANGTSSFNPKGDDAVCKFAQDLVKWAGVSQSEIHVMSMYRTDVEELQSKLEALGLNNIEVSTVHSFQGSQNKIILLHFVASTLSPTHPVGHFGEPHRLCVAIPRAQEFQFFFGDLSRWDECRLDPKNLFGRSVDHQHIVAVLDYVQRYNQVAHWPS